MEADPLPAGPGPGRDACGTAVRSVTLSVPDLDQTISFFGDALGLPRSEVRLHEPEHEELWYLAGARPNWRPFQLPGAGVVYVNDSQGFSVELLWAKPGKSDRDWGFEPLPIEDRPLPDTHSITQSVQVAAPPERAWTVLMDHEGMSTWSGFKPVTLDRPGETERNGRGAVRSLGGPLGAVLEQITCAEAPRLIRYRVIKGSPFVCHQGEIRLEPRDGGTEITWTVRFRPKVPGTGALLARIFGRMLGSAMCRGLKARIEAA